MTKYLEDISDYWDTRARGYSLDNQAELESEQATKWLQLIERYVSIKKEWHVLDLGCGPGFFSILLSQIGCRVTAIDYSDKMLQEAKANAEKYKTSIDFKKMDAHQLMFQDQSFDLIITRNVTWNLEQPMIAYQEMLRVLKPSGHLLNYDGNYYYHYTDEDYNRKMHREHQHMEGIDVSKIDGIAGHLELSKHLRPYWDEEVFKQLGVSSIEWDILNKEINSLGKTMIRSFLIHVIK